MSYVTKLICFIILVLCTNPLLAQDTRYRVELLVLTHLNHGEEAADSNDISDYSAAIDFLTPVEEPEEGAEEDISASLETENPLPQLVDSGAAQEPDPNEVVHIEDMSEVMRETWRRLRLSAPFRPQQYLSWEQGNQEPFPALRIHDLEVIMSQDPYAEQRLEIVEGVEPGEDPAESALPEPTLYYRLDGAVTLRRSRFLHLDLDIQLREGIWEPEPMQPIAQAPAIFEQAGPTAFLVHELQQSRQVKTERMEYFDGPVLSVLAFITSIKVNSEDSP